MIVHRQHLRQCYKCPQHHHRCRACCVGARCQRAGSLVTGMKGPSPLDIIECCKLLNLNAITHLSEDGVGCPVASSPAQVVRHKVMQPKGVVLRACRMQAPKYDPHHALVEK